MKVPTDCVGFVKSGQEAVPKISYEWKKVGSL